MTCEDAGITILSSDHSLKRARPLTDYYNYQPTRQPQRLDWWLSLNDLRYYSLFFDASNQYENRLFYLGITANLLNYVHYIVERWRQSIESYIAKSGDSRTSVSPPDIAIAMRIAAVGPRISTRKEPRAEMIHALSRLSGDINAIIPDWRIGLPNTEQVINKWGEVINEHGDTYTVFGMVIVHGNGFGLNEERLSVVEALLKSGANPDYFIFDDASEISTKLGDLAGSATNRSRNKSFSYLLHSEDLEIVRLLRRYGAKAPDSYPLQKIARLWHKIRTERKSDILKEFMAIANDIEAPMGNESHYDEDNTVATGVMYAAQIMLSTSACLI
jgi:hypothetical protein